MPSPEQHMWGGGSISGRGQHRSCHRWEGFPNSPSVQPQKQHVLSSARISSSPANLEGLFLSWRQTGI